ncbi:xanthine dehydrogenase/oxidase [Pelomyxa schiedti]|nr:xanthine dehydrogenase/oxidase [Pelomyxa schiedti]
MFCCGVEVGPLLGQGKTLCGQFMKHLHAIQELLINNHGYSIFFLLLLRAGTMTDRIQCGYCTPGIVMSLYGAAIGQRCSNDVENLTVNKVHRVDNICRCTGYQPILKTEAQVFSQEGIQPPAFPAQLIPQSRELTRVHYGEGEWISPFTLEDFLNELSSHPTALIIGGGTNYFRKMYSGGPITTVIHTHNVCEMCSLQFDEKEGLSIGAAVTITCLAEFLHKSCSSLRFWKKQSVEEIITFLTGIRSQQFRNASTIGGSLVQNYRQSCFSSLFLILGAEVTVVSPGKDIRVLQLDTSQTLDLTLAPLETLLKIYVPAFSGYLRTFSQPKPVATMAVAVTLSLDTNSISQCSVAFTGLSPLPSKSSTLNKTLVGQHFTNEAIQECLGGLETDFPGIPQQYLVFARNSLLQAVSYSKGTSKLHNLNSIRTFTSVGTAPMGRELPLTASPSLVMGLARFVDDLPEISGTLHGAYVLAKTANAFISGINTTKAQNVAGFFGIVYFEDIPNKLHSKIFAQNAVEYVGQPIALVLASTRHQARCASQAVEVQYRNVSPAVLTFPQALQKRAFLGESLRISNMKGEEPPPSQHVIEGTVELGSQAHFYMETHRAYAVPSGDDSITIYSSSMAPTDVQAVISTSLNLESNQVIVKVPHIGGNFGGKGFRSALVAAAAAVAANKTHRPVKLVLEREEDMLVAGKRVPYYIHYQAGFLDSGKMVFLTLDYMANGGSFDDAGSMILKKSMQHAENVYDILSFQVNGILYKTNTAPNTAFRGFGTPQALFATEQTIERIAAFLGKPSSDVRKLNFYQDGAISPYGQQLGDVHMERMWEELFQVAHIAERIAALKQFNLDNQSLKKGISVIPSKYGIGSGCTMMAQATALVSIYAIDGSITIYIGGVEQGQGLHTKITQIAAAELGAPIQKVTVAQATTECTPNAGASTSSQQTDINGMAVLDACRQINSRLLPIKNIVSPKTSQMEYWQSLIHTAHSLRVDLSAHGHYATPGLHFNWDTGKGTPFHYYTWGIAAAEVEVNVMTGEYIPLQVDVMMDVGNSINPAIDVGQIEGGFVQGMGMFTMEELSWDKSTGALQNTNLHNYTIPRAKDTPRMFNTHFYQKNPNSKLASLNSSRGIGEPTLFLGSSVLFALQNATNDYRKSQGRTPVFFNSPTTREKLLQALSEP